MEPERKAWARLGSLGIYSVDKTVILSFSRIKYLTIIVMYSFIHLIIYLLIQGSLIKHAFIMTDTVTIKIIKNDPNSERLTTLVVGHCHIRKSLLIL